MAADPILDRVPPHNLEAEMSVLGAAFLDKDSYVVTSQYVTADSFYRGEHRLLWAAVQQVYEAGLPMDLVTIKESLRAAGKLEEVGGDEYLIVLADSVPTVASAEFYAKIVKDKARLRALLQMAADTIREVHKAEATADDVSCVLEGRLVTDSVQSGGDNVPFSTAIGQVMKVLLSEGALAYGLETGFVGIDRRLHGFRPKTLTILAARPGVGKSALAHNMIDRLCLDGVPVGLITLEMGQEEVAIRMLSKRAQVGVWKTERGKINDIEADSLALAAEAMATMPLYIADRAVMSVSEIRAQVRRWVMRHGVRIVFIDYLQLVKGDRGRGDSREQEVSSISRALKGLAKECEIPVVALSQLNRGVEAQKRPTLANLRESGAIEQDADAVIFLWRGEEEGMIEGSLEKNRHGPTGDFLLAWRAEYTTFSDGERTRQPPAYKQIGQQAPEDPQNSMRSQDGSPF